MARFGTAELARERRVGDQGTVVGDDDLAEQAFEDQQHAVECLARMESAWLLHLGQKVRGPLNRAGDQMRKEADEQRVVHQRIGGAQLAPVDVDDVGDFLKGVEGDRWWQHDAPDRARHMQSCQRGHVREGIDEETEVLEETQAAEIQYEGEREQEPALRRGGAGLKTAGDEVVHHGGGAHQQQKAPVPPAVEEVACGEQEQVLRAQPQPPVEQYDERQEDDVDGRIEIHASAPARALLPFRYARHTARGRAIPNSPRVCRSLPDWPAQGCRQICVAFTAAPRPQGVRTALGPELPGRRWTLGARQR